MATDSEIIQHIDSLAQAIRDRLENVETQTIDQERRITRLEALLLTIEQRFSSLEELVRSRSRLEEQQWKIIMTLLALLALMTGGAEIARLLFGLVP